MKRSLIFIIIFGTFLLTPMVAQNMVTFTGMVSTDWNNAKNWSPARVPLPTDNVIIPSGFSVTNQPGVGVGAINSLNLMGMLTIDTATLTLQSTTVTSTINNLTLTSTLGQYGYLTMNGPTTFSGILVLNPGQVNGNGAATITGPVMATNGSSLGPASVDNKAQISIPDDSAQVTLGNVSFTNDTNGSILLEGDGIIIRGNGPFNNLGSITKSMGTGTTTFSPGSPFTNGTGATVSAGSGTLLLLIVGTSTGTFNADSGATLQFANTVTLNAGTTFGGSGTIDIATNGVWDVEAPVTVNTTNLAFDGGTGTIIRGGSNLTINSPTVNWNSGVLGASAGQLTLLGGATMYIQGSGFHGLSMNLVLSGTVNMAADLQVAQTTITIKPNAIFNIPTDNGIHGSGGGVTINNGGTFEKTGIGTSTLDYNGTFNVVAKNAEPVAVNSGTLNFAVSGGGTLGGTWNTDSGATVMFSMGNYTLPADSKFIGEGTTSLAGANWVLAGKNVSVSTGEFKMTGSTISGAFDLTLLSPSIFLGGARTGEIQKGKPVGTIKIPKKASQVSVPDSTTFTLDGCTLENGSAHFYIFGSVVVQDSAVLLNQKGGIITLDVAAGVATAAIQLSGGAFSNLGTVTLSTFANTTQTIMGAWANAGNLTVPNGSTLSVPQGYVNTGATTIPGGTVILGEQIDFQSGMLFGTGSISGTAGVNNTGATVEAGNETPGSGTGILSLSVPLTQGTGASITALISGTTPGAQYDQINSTSSMELAGTLNLQFGKGFTPTPSESFNILNFSSYTGSFSTVNVPSGFTANLNFTSTALTVTFSSAPGALIRPKAAVNRPRH